MSRVELSAVKRSLFLCGNAEVTPEPCSSSSSTRKCSRLTKVCTSSRKASDHCNRITERRFCINQKKPPDFPNDRETKKCCFQEKMTTSVLLIHMGRYQILSFNGKIFVAFVQTPFCANQTAMPGPPRFCHHFQHQLSLQSYI